MKAVILAGGKGTRISEESQFKPKPMIEIGGKPILWHIMKIYSEHGINDFVICCGHLGYVIKEYFSNYFLHNSDVTLDLKKGAMKIHDTKAEPWTVTLVDTGVETHTGGRLKRVLPYLGKEDFCMTYGDGVSDVDISALTKHHKASKKLVTVTAVLPPGRFGSLAIKDGVVTKFIEKPLGDGSYINGGFFVMSPKAFSYVKDDATPWERQPLEKLAKDKQLSAFVHDGFWQPMDTLRDKNYLEELWAKGNAPWACWK